MNKLEKVSELTDPHKKNLQGKRQSYFHFHAYLTFHNCASDISYKRKSLDFEWALNLNRLSLRLMGVWPGDEDVPGIAGLAVFLRVPIMVFFIFGFIFLPQMYALTLVYRELPLVIDNLMTSSAALMSCVKLFFIWHSKKGKRQCT